MSSGEVASKRYAGSVATRVRSSAFCSSMPSRHAQGDDKRETQKEARRSMRRRGPEGGEAEHTGRFQWASGRRTRAKTRLVGDIHPIRRCRLQCTLALFAAELFCPRWRNESKLIYRRSHPVMLHSAHRSASGASQCAPPAIEPARMGSGGGNALAQYTQSINIAHGHKALRARGRTMVPPATSPPSSSGVLCNF